jgi:5'-nucleotidase
VIDDEGLLRPVIGKPPLGRVLLGGHAGLVEEMLGLSGSQFLYVGDHAYDDVHISKKLRRWRTALIIRELEGEIHAQEEFRARQEKLERLMDLKVEREHELACARLELQRRKRAGQPAPGKRGGAAGRQAQPGLRTLERTADAARQTLGSLDDQITPLARASAELLNRNWGLLMRSGNDTSYLGRIVERHADIYMSRVSNLLSATPFAFFRAHRGLMPHDERLGMS